MAASYKPLFKLLIDRNMKKKELAERAGLSLATITKMGKEGAIVTTDVLVKICTALNCTMNDIVEKCGFSSVSYFASTFKKNVGITPSEFRQKKYII